MMVRYPENLWRSVRPTDTLLLETIQLAFRGGQWFYIPAVEDQNHGQPIHFAIIYLGEAHFISENPGNDYPQRIIYQD